MSCPLRQRSATLRAALLAATLGATIGAAAPELGAQDVEMLGRQYGTRPPPEYYETRARSAGAFEFRRAWKARLEGGGGVEADPGLGLQRAGGAGPLRDLGPREGTVEGEISFPLVLGLFADTPDSAAVAADSVHAEFFDGPTSSHGTIPEYYEEVSGGRVHLKGVTYDWLRSDLDRATVADGSSGLGPGARVGDYIVDLLEQLDGRGVDWGRFDNDGPDGIPNSADDDGYVDVLAVMHPTRGGECGGSDRDERVWSHRWVLSGATSEKREYVTDSPSGSADNPTGRVRIDDYTIQPVLSCDQPARTLNEIGVMAHELGHGFGLPDLYCTRPNCGFTGAGNWDLMGTGTWGCEGSNPARPCHLGAWSKAALGWADVEVLESDRDHGELTLPPVETSETVYRIDAGDGSGEYFLVENRSPGGGFDGELVEPGLLVWHVDPDLVRDRWPFNQVNVFPDHLGVWLRQADGDDDLARSGGRRGDDGDPFPGSTGATAFHAGSTPGSVTHEGRAAGVTLLEIRRDAGGDVRFRALTRYQSLRLRVEGAAGGSSLLTVDGAPAPMPEHELFSAPFERHAFEAAAGDSLAEGLRVGFQGWDDGAPRVREFVTGLVDTTLVARYGGRELRFAVAVESPVEGLEPGRIDLDPGTDDGWVPEGGTISVTAEPRTGFGFVEWGGILEGEPNPTVLTVEEPVSASAAFRQTFAADHPARIDAEAAADHVIVLEAAHANAPVEWTLLDGELPRGMEFPGDGRIVGVPLETGSFPLSLRLRDGIGLEDTSRLELRVGEARISLETLAGPFLGRGTALTDAQALYLDRTGNDNGSYDLGDLRAFVLDNPDVPLTGALGSRVGTAAPADRPPGRLEDRR